MTNCYENAKNNITIMLKQ